MLLLLKPISTSDKKIQNVYQKERKEGGWEVAVVKLPAWFRPSASKRTCKTPVSWAQASMEEKQEDPGSAYLAELEFGVH